MKLLEILSKEERKVYRVKGTNCIYKFEKGVLYIGNVDFKRWHESEVRVNDLMKIEVEELVENKSSRKMFKGEAYYFINDEGSIVEDEEDFTIVDDNRYEIGNYFESKAEAEECRELIIKTIKTFKAKRNKEKEFKEKEFKEISMIRLHKNSDKKLTIGSNFGSLDDFKRAKECIYLDINGECIGLSFSEWDLLNQYIEKLKKF